MFDCSTDKYDVLYAPWLRDPGRLLDLAEYRPGEKLLDLCGGTGAVSKVALQRCGGEKSDITLLDINPRCFHTAVEGFARIGLRGRKWRLS